MSLEDVNLEPQTATEPRDDREEHLAQVRALVGRLPPAYTAYAAASYQLMPETGFW